MLAHQVAESRAGPTHRLDLEHPADLNRLLEDPMLVLDEMRGLVVIDEIQRRPDLFPVLRVLADRHPRPATFLVLGSASPNLVWLRGGFPRAFLASANHKAWLWLDAFARTFLERDLPELGVRVPAPAMRRFWTMLGHWHGQIWKSSEFARSFGVADTTVRRYLDILTGALVVRQLQPWHANIAKRRKRPRCTCAIPACCTPC